MHLASILNDEKFFELKAGDCGRLESDVSAQRVAASTRRYRCDRKAILPRPHSDISASIQRYRYQHAASEYGFIDEYAFNSLRFCSDIITRSRRYRSGHVTKVLRAPEFFASNKSPSFLPV